MSDKLGQSIDRVRCVSQDISRYNFYKFWFIDTTDCAFLHPSSGLGLRGAFRFVFLPDDQPLHWFSAFNGRFRDNYCFAVYDARKKVSSAKRYRFSCPKGGYVVKDGRVTAFKEGSFEFLFRVEGPDTEY
jgi:hypothetical protein